MLSPHHFLSLSLLICSSLLPLLHCGEASEPSIYEALQSHGRPMGLLPKGISDFSLDASGKFEVHLDLACSAKFEDDLHYGTNVSGTLLYGRIDDLSGISAQDLFLWFPVIGIRVDVPSSGLIYFNVGVVSKQFSLSPLSSRREIAPPLRRRISGVGLEIFESQSKELIRYETRASRRIRYETA